MFSNRDYVFNRRYMIDTQTKVIIIVNKITEHPSCPEKPELYRVKDYWSFMTIKPYTELEEVSYLQNDFFKVSTKFRNLHIYSKWIMEFQNIYIMHLMK